MRTLRNAPLEDSIIFLVTYLSTQPEHVYMYPFQDPVIDGSRVQGKQATPETIDINLPACSQWDSNT